MTGRELIFLVIILLLFCILVPTLALTIFARKGKEGADRETVVVD
jgi:hypothetical protein